jgi:predicted phage terminase large subunit-like protein
VVVDDPIKPKEVTKQKLKACQDWWKHTMFSRARDQKTVRRICIMQRLHQDDLAGMFLAEGGWEHLRIPMKFEPKEACSTSRWKDPRVSDGELLWPEKFPDTVVKDLDKMGQYVVASQYQQRPAPEAGNIFQRAWFQSYNPKSLPVWDQLCQSWDCTFKDSDNADFVVGQVWGRRGSSFYLLDEVRRRMNFQETVYAIKEMRRKWPKANAILIEDKANGPAVESVLGKEISGIVMVNPMGGKISRANAVQPFFEAMNVLHPAADYVDEEGDRPYGWIDAHREELANFPTGSHDDRVDACTQALIWLAEKRSALVNAMLSITQNPNVFG